MVAALGIAGSAVAQGGPNDLDLYPYGVTLRGGIVLPVDRTLSNVASTLVNIGLDYDLRSSLFKTGETYISADYIFRGFGKSGGGSIVPLMLNQRMYTSDVDFKRSYFFFGVGVVFVNVGGAGRALAARGGVGMELGPRTIAEVALLLSDRAGGARANALTINIGYRF